MFFSRYRLAFLVNIYMATRSSVCGGYQIFTIQYTDENVCARDIGTLLACFQNIGARCLCMLADVSLRLFPNSSPL